MVDSGLLDEEDIVEEVQQHCLTAERYVGNNKASANSWACMDALPDGSWVCVRRERAAACTGGRLHSGVARGFGRARGCSAQKL